MAVVRFLPRAEKDLLELPEHLQDEILEKADLLKEFPEMGPVMEQAYSGYRFLLADRNHYRIIYKVVSAALVEVRYIRHCRRQSGLRIVKI